MKTPSPISKVSACRKPAPGPISHAVADADGERAQDRAPHEGVELAGALDEASSQLDDRLRRHRRPEVGHEAVLEVGVGHDHAFRVGRGRRETGVRRGLMGGYTIALRASSVHS